MEGHNYNYLCLQTLILAGDSRFIAKAFFVNATALIDVHARNVGREQDSE